MKRTQLKRKTPLLNGHKPLKRTSTLRVVGNSTAAQLKRDIQHYLWLIVQIRDGGCIMRGRFNHVCSGFTKEGRLILQADHLISRAHAGTYADDRLVVCVCKGLHGWKSVGSNLRKDEYDRLVRNVLHPDIVDLWERAEAEKWRPVKVDWALELVRLKQLYRKMGGDNSN